VSFHPSSKFVGSSLLGAEPSGRWGGDHPGGGTAQVVQSSSDNTCWCMDPEGRRPSPTAVVLTGALVLKWTHRTVDSFILRLGLEVRATRLRSAGKKLHYRRTPWSQRHAKTCQPGTFGVWSSSLNSAGSFTQVRRVQLTGRRAERKVGRRSPWW